MSKNQGIPRIDSELMVGMALLQWSARQLSDYSVAIGYPVSVQSIEDCLSMPFARFELSASSVVLGNLVETLATLGLGFVHEVFGVTRSPYVRLKFGDTCRSATDAIGVLLQNLSSPKITLGVQKPAGKSGQRSLVVLVETPYSAKLLFDAGPLADDDLESIVTLLYSAWLTRLVVVAEYIPNRRSSKPEAAILGVLDAPSLPASTLSKSRTLQLLSSEDSQ